MSCDTNWRTEPRIMGGMFGLPERLDGEGTLPPFPLERGVFLANGRSCLILLIELLSPHRVWLPSYLCPSIIAAVRKTGVPYSFYAVDYDLCVSPGALARVCRGELVAMIDYFGFPADRALMTQARAAGAWVLEDACQALLTSGVGRAADFVLFTPRKFIGVPEGGVLISNCPEVNLQDVQLQPPPPDWWLRNLSAAVLRREFDLYGGERSWFKLYHALEEDMPMGRFAMSELSKLLMTSAFDYASIGRIRVENYRCLAGELSHLALYPSLAPGVVPLGFPVRLANRDEVKRMLYEHDIFPPVHWPFGGRLPEEFAESYRLLGDIMMLPCDQRYEKADMLCAAGLVNQSAAPVQQRACHPRALPVP